jgi:predicted choloylglycine hydrolase
LGSGGDRILGRNFDWHNRQTLLLFTDPPDGYASTSMVDISYLDFPAQNPSWADRVKLLDAPYLPFDGLNERGLAVGMMAVPRARDSSDPQKVTIGSLHAIRLMLDYAKNVSEAVALLQAYAVDFGGGPPIHYLVADASGDSAVIEYLDGRMTVLRNENPWQVSTNFIIAEQTPKGADSSCWRYNKVYKRLKETGGTLSSAEAMALLQDVSQPSTVWSAVYNLTDGGIQVAMGREYDQVHTFRLRPKDE